MKVTIARIRSNVKYNAPLNTVLDSFFENYVLWKQSRPDLEFDTYNMSFDKSRPVRTPETIKNADVISFSWINVKFSYLIVYFTKKNKKKTGKF